MTLTFRSSRPEERIFIEREPDGRQRVARAVQSEHNARHWNLELEHPSGERWSGTYTGDAANVPLALGELLARHEHDFRDDRARGDRRRQPTRDTSVRLDDFGNAIGGAPIKSWR